MKVWIWTLAGVIAVTGVTVGGAIWYANRESERLSVETEAVGLVATPAEWYDSGDEENVQGHTLTYAYVVGDEVIPVTLNEVTWYDPGTSYKVCYNPEDGSDARLYSSTHVCGS
jgi:hypothetical protein